MKTVGILNLGCPRNIVDAENTLGRLIKKGYKVTDLDKAEVAIINTCAFIEDAKKESIEAILEVAELKKLGRLKKIIVAGCLSQRYKDQLRRELPEVDAFVGAVKLGQSDHRFAITPRHYAYLKICESCINNCSFCVIPKIKGKFTSLDINAALRQVRRLNKDKISELNIIGQDISGYGLDLYGERALPDLLRKIVKAAKNIGWIRVLYLYPDKIVDELLKVIKDEPKICRYIDLPIQHINGRILKLMNRRSTKDEIVSLIEKIRKTIPDVAIRTSLIVGFPTETRKEFQELLGFIRQMKFERLGAFAYSREEGTKAFGLSGQVPQKEKLARLNEVMQVQKIISEEVNRNFLGREMRVLIEEKGKDYYLARSEYDAPEVDGNVFVRPQKDAFEIGSFIKVKIIDTLEYDLVGEALK